MLGKTMREIRVQKGVSLRQAAKLLRINICLLSRYENETEKIILDDLQKMWLIYHIEGKEKLHLYREWKTENASIIEQNKKSRDIDMEKIGIIFDSAKDKKKKSTWAATCTCGGEIACIKSGYNGHVRAKCSKCGFVVMQ